MRKILTLMLLAALACSCNREYLEVEEEMTGCNGIGLWIKGERVFEYSDNLCQYSWNPDDFVFRSFDDSMTEWFSVSMDSVPLEEGDKVTATLKWTTRTDIKTKKGVELKVIKTERQKIWLWSRKTGTGAIIEVIKK